MRYDLKKFLFVGVEEERSVFFSRAQEAGVIHFVDPKSMRIQGMSKPLQQLSRSIKILRTLPVVEQEETEEYEVSEGMAKRIIDLKSEIDLLLTQIRMLDLEISRIEIFGSFSMEDLKYIDEKGNRIVQFFCAKQAQYTEETLPQEVIWVGSDHGLDYFIAIHSSRKQYPKMIEMEVTRSVDEVKKEREQKFKRLHQVEDELKKYAKYQRFLHRSLGREMDAFHLEQTKDFVSFPLQELSAEHKKENSSQLFCIEGWVPEHRLEELKTIAADSHVHIEEIDPNEGEVMPTYLENEGISKIGEDLVVKIYDTPSNTDKDPSLWVLFFFSLFFAMIIGDGGYGLVILMIGLYVKYKNKEWRGVKQRVVRLITILGFSCIVWGILTTSFFGIPVAPNHPVQRFSLMNWLVKQKTSYHMRLKDATYKEWVKKYPDLKNVESAETFLLQASHVNQKGSVVYDAYSKFSDNIMLELALFIGVIHILISMGRYLRRNWSYLGWMILIIGAYLAIPKFLEAASLVNFALGIDQEAAAKNGLYMVYGGLAIAVLVAVYKQKLLGLLEASQLIQIFGDVLSYLRLYALGLAGSLLTSTMLDLAGSVPIVFGVIIVLLGHMVNIVLGIMGGVIHGLRLNFLEWYHYCFEGGGKLFNPLKRHDVE